jgi:transcriptional regulator with XRE-family HTH domain
VKEADAVAIRLGRAVRVGRYRVRRTQREIAAIAGVDQATVSRIELGLGENVDLKVWTAVAHAVGLDLSVAPVSTEREAAGRTLIADSAIAGGWIATAGNDETVLARGDDRVVAHVWDVVTSVTFDVDRLAASVHREALSVNQGGGRASGLVVIPEAEGNRRRVSELRFELRETFTASGRAWYRCLVHRDLPMPSAPGILWAFRDYERLRPARDLPGWIWIAVGDRPRYAAGRRKPARRAV